MNQPESDSGTPLAPPGSPRERWELRKTKTDVVHKILISIIGAALAAGFIMYQQGQAERQSSSALMNQREQADSSLRTEMFKELWHAYFRPGDPGSSATGARSSGECNNRSSLADDTQLLGDLRRESMLIDVLVRNFDNVDVRPLFEAIDMKLSTCMQKPEIRATAYHLRESLRRVAFGSASRQTNSIVARAGATVFRVTATQCAGGAPEPVGDKNPIILPTKDKPVQLFLDEIEEDGVRVSLNRDAIRAGQNLNLTFKISPYDMPVLENVVLPDRHRMAFTIGDYGSSAYCEQPDARRDHPVCEYLVDQVGHACRVATINVITIPETYISTRDRPFISDAYSVEVAKPFLFDTDAH